MEIADTDSLFAEPKHPYTEALLSAVPKTDPLRKTKRILLEGEVPDPSNPTQRLSVLHQVQVRPAACVPKKEPPLIDIAGAGQPEHRTACHFAAELHLRGVGSLRHRPRWREEVRL